MTESLTPPAGWDPDTYRPPACPQCRTPVDVDWVEVGSLGSTQSTWLPGKLSCPTSRYHDVEGAYRQMRTVTIAHPDREGSAWCPLSDLDLWRSMGWYPLDPEHQTSAEAVQQRVQEMGGHEAWCQMLKSVPPGFMFDTLTCNCRGIPDVDDTP